MEMKNIALYLGDKLANAYHRFGPGKKSTRTATAILALALSGDVLGDGVPDAEADKPGNKPVATLESRIRPDPDKKPGLKWFKLEDSIALSAISRMPTTAPPYQLLFPVPKRESAKEIQRAQLPSSMKLPAVDLQEQHEPIEEMTETLGALYSAFLLKTFNHELGHTDVSKQYGIGADIAVDVGGLKLSSDYRWKDNIGLFGATTRSRGKDISRRHDEQITLGGFAASQKLYEHLRRTLDKNPHDTSTFGGKVAVFTQFFTGIDFPSYYLLNPPGTDYKDSDVNALVRHSHGIDMKRALFADALKMAGVELEARIPGTNYMIRLVPSAQFDPKNGVIGPGFFGEIYFKR